MNNEEGKRPMQGIVNALIMVSPLWVWFALWLIDYLTK